jgi:hypothetical protein
MGPPAKVMRKITGGNAAACLPTRSGRRVPFFFQADAGLARCDSFAVASEVRQQVTRLAE